MNWVIVCLWVDSVLGADGDCYPLKFATGVNNVKLALCYAYLDKYIAYSCVQILCQGT
jgi:hypothetical protein